MEQSELGSVIKLNEIKNYLSSQDLITLSLSCKYFRKIFSSEVFSSLNFRNFAIYRNYRKECISKEDYEYKEIEKLLNQIRCAEDSINAGEEHNENNFHIGYGDINGYNDNIMDEYAYGSIEELSSEAEDSESCESFSDEEEDDILYVRNPYRPLPKSYLESKAKFQSHLREIPYQPTKLNLFDIGNYYYLLYDIPSVLFNLKSLIVKNSTIQVEAFQYLLDNLIKLEVVELTDCYLNVQELHKKFYTVDWPLNLKKLVIENNLVGFVRDVSDYIATDRLYSLEFEPIYLTPEPKRLPNLHTLCIETRDPRFAFGAGYGERYFKFLKANPHVKKLQIGFDSFKPEFFEIISKFNSLKELKLCIENVGDFYGYKCIKSPTLTNLNNLSLTLYQSSAILPIIAEQFPNVTKLSLITKFYDSNDLKILPSRMKSFINLKDFKLKIYAECILKTLDFSNHNFKSLEILWRQLDDMENFMRNVKTSLNLKNALYNVNKFEERELNPELKLGLNEAQRLLPFPHRISFYKIY
jgi:CRISPR/Cas system CMR-associated protein Cmr5 small subunit